MRTPGASLSKRTWLADATQKCMECGSPLRPGQEKFCGDKCRWKADENARKAVERIKKLLSRRDPARAPLATVLAFDRYLESRPESAGEQRDHTASVLHELDLLLSHRGPSDPGVRSFVRVQADAIRLAFEINRPRYLDDCRHYVQALEILRDAGLENPDDEETLLQYGWAVVAYYARHRDYLHLARSLQALANTYRLNQDEVRGRRITHYAWHILNEKFSKTNDPKTLAIVHQSAFWDLRLFQNDIELSVVEQKRQQIIGLAEQVNTPGIWIETHRELAGHFGRGREYEARASEEIEQIDKIRRQNPNLTTYGAPTLLRPKIELLLGFRSKTKEDEAKHLIETEYLSLYHRDPHIYYYRQLKKWKQKYGLSFHLPAPTYASPILAWLPRGSLSA